MRQPILLLFVLIAELLIAAGARSQTAALSPELAQAQKETDPARRLHAVTKLLKPLHKANVDALIKLGESDPDAAVRKEIVNRLGKVNSPQVAEFLERRASSDTDANVALLALERLRMLQAERLGQAFEERLAKARTGNDAASLKALIPESQRWASYSRGAILPAFLQAAPLVFQAVPPGKPVRAVAIGDWGTGNSNMTKTAAAAAAYHRDHPFDFGLTLGDNFPSEGMTGTADPRWKSEWEQVYGRLGIPFFASTGNHDWGLADSPAAEILYSHESRTWRMPAAYYSFTAGDVQFFALATQALSAAQLQWLDEELGRSKARWKIVYGHHPIYSYGQHGDTKGFDKSLLPVLKGRAHVYLVGHEHMAQHLKAEGGVHLFVNPVGGQGLRPAQSGPRTLYAGSFYGFTVIEAGADKLAVRFMDADGKTQYETAIR